MAAADVKNGAFTANTVATVTFTARYATVEVKNEDPTVTDSMFVTTNGTVPTVGGDDCFEVSAGERELLPNNGPLWYQGFSTSPGTTVKLISAGAGNYEVVGTS